MKYEYRLYKISFTAPVHFGTGVLNESAVSFCADTLFSALYIEALKLDLADQLYNMVKDDQLLISDAFPYIGKRYFLPKPMLYVEPSKQGDSSEKKRYKKIKYIPVGELQHFFSGDLDPEVCSLQALGKEYSQVMIAVRRKEEDALPYRVGNFLFSEGCGLYIIAAIEKEEGRMLLEELLESLSYSGIGGKRGSGKGRFVLKHGKMDATLQVMLERESDRCMLISSALPKEHELEKALKGASYLIQKRSGFVYSANYADEEMKKRDLYTMQAGSCFKQRFSGAVYDVSEGGNHAVYRYAKGMFLGV
jgi:CRISPR-associated protein Csm4